MCGRAAAEKRKEEESERKLLMQEESERKVLGSRCLCCRAVSRFSILCTH
jgi:hypothetical protein